MAWVWGGTKWPMANMEKSYRNLFENNFVWWQKLLTSISNLLRYTVYFRSLRDTIPDLNTAPTNYIRHTQSTLPSTQSAPAPGDLTPLDITLLWIASHEAEYRVRCNVRQKWRGRRRKWENSTSNCSWHTTYNTYCETVSQKPGQEGEIWSQWSLLSLVNDWTNMLFLRTPLFVGVVTTLGHSVAL